MTLCPPIRHMALVASLFVAFALMPAPRAGAATAAEAQSEAANSQAGIDNWALPSPKSTSPKSSSPKKAVATPLTKPALPKPIAPISTALKSPPAKNGGLQIQGLTGSSVPWSIVIMLTALTLIPSLLLCVTPFARLLIVFHFLRQALGLQTTPSNQMLIGLSLILTFFLMQPVATQIFETAVVPAEAGQIT